MNYEERSGTVGPVQVPPKLLIERLTDGDVTCLRLSGAVDEQFDAPGLAETITSKYLLLDLAGVDRISSFGIRQWVDFIGNITPRMAGIYYVECSPKVVDQFNMVANFGGPGYIVSFYAPYRCDSCDQERRLLFRTDEEAPLWKAGQAPPSMCPTCGNPEDFDEDPATYFNYVAQQPPAQIPREVMNFLRVHLSYAQGGQRKLKIEKKIDGRTTFLKLSGDLDSDLKAQKLADGLEGEVVLDLGGILSIDPVGTAQWRKLMTLLDAKTGTDESVDRILFLSVPAPFLERLGRPEELTKKGQVLSLLIPYNCSRCRATTQRLVDFAQHGEELRQGRVPRVKCGICGGPVTCVVSETWFSRLQSLQTPQVSPELRTTLARLTAPPPAAPATSGGMRNTLMPGATAGPAQGLQASTPGWTAQPSGPPSMVGMPAGMPGLGSNPRATLSPLGTAASAALSRPEIKPAQSSPPAPTTLLGRLQAIPGFLPGLLVVMLSLSGAVVYRILSSPVSGKKAGEWQVVESSQPKAPAWHDPKYTPQGKDELLFIGRSPLLTDKKDALERADIAAQADLAARLGETLAGKNPEWRKAVASIYTDTQRQIADDIEKAQRDLKIKGTDAAAESALSQAREHLAEANKRVATALLASGVDAVQAPPVQYWEKRARTLKGSRESAYLASSLIELPSTDFDKLLTAYSQSEAATKVKVRLLPYFPLAALRYDETVNGAIVVEVDDQSPFGAAGLQPSDVIVSIMGTDVKTAAEAAKLVDKAFDESLTREVVVKVQRGDQLTVLKVTRKKAGKGPAGGGKKR